MHATWEHGRATDDELLTVHVDEPSLGHERRSLLQLKVEVLRPAGKKQGLVGVQMIFRERRRLKQEPVGSSDH